MKRIDTRRNLMRTLLVAAALLLFASLFSACGKLAARATASGAHNSLRSTADINGNGSAASSPGKLHVPATWQDTRGFTPYEDYRPDQILALFNDELSQDALDAPPGAGQPPINYGSLIVKSPAHAQFARSLASRYGIWVVESAEAYIPGFYFCTYQLPPYADAEPLMQRILDENSADVRLVEYNPVYTLAYQPNDPKVQDNTQWFHNATHNDDYGAWDVNAGGNSAVYVAVLDTGVDLNHPDLEANVLAVDTLWPNEDFDLGNDDTDRIPQDNNGHGTHCAGIIAAVGDNSTGGCGVAYNCKILPIKLSDASGNFTGSTPVALALATMCGAKVVSMSFGSYFPSEAMKAACETAFSDGLVLVGAAGNDNNGSQTHYPAGIPVVIAVGATDSSNNKAGYSNYGSHLDIAAPGTSIYSTVYNNTYTTYQGTSMACPMVAGAAALLISEFGGTADNAQVRGLLESTGATFSGDPWGNTLVRRLNTANAIAGTPGDAPEVVITSPAYNDPVTGPFQIQCEVTHTGGGSIQRALLYLDGVLWDYLDAPGDTFAFDCDATDRFPAGMSVVVEVIDDEYMHGFANSNFVITDPHVFKGPYYESFDGNSATHWTAKSFSGAASWQLNLEAAGPPPDYELRLGNPILYSQNDVDWLYSPLFDLRNTQQAKLVFHAKYDVSQTKPIFMALWSQTASGVIGMFYDTGDDWYSYNLNGFCAHEPTPGQTVQFFWMLEGSDDGGQRYLAIDDFYIVRPTALPTVSIDFPAEGMTVNGFVPLTVTVNDDYMWQLDRCEIFANGTLIATTHDPDWGTMLDTSTLPSGPLTLTATVYEDDGYDRDAIDDYSEDTDTMESVTATRNAFIAHQSVASFTPSSGFYNDEVTITGNGFGVYDAGADSVLFSGSSGMLAAPVTSWNDTEIICNVPVGAQTGKLRVDINGAWRDSADEFTVFSPYDDFTYSYENAPPDLMFIESFYIRIAAQPDLDSITVRLAGYPAKEWSVATLGNASDTMMLIDMSELGTGAYSLELEGFVGTYSETIGGMFFMNPLPGDFNGNGVVDDPDTAYLLNYLELAGGAVPEGDPLFYPFLDVNEDGFVDEADAAFVGYHWGDTPQDT